MLEYLPRSELADALAALRRRLAPTSCLLVVITRKTLVSKLMIEWAWKANAYSVAELREAFINAGFSNLRFEKFPPSYFWMNITNYVAVGRDYQLCNRPVARPHIQMAAAYPPHDFHRGEANIGTLWNGKCMKRIRAS